MNKAYSFGSEHKYSLMNMLSSYHTQSDQLSDLLWGLQMKGHIRTVMDRYYKKASEENYHCVPYSNKLFMDVMSIASRILVSHEYFDAYKNASGKKKVSMVDVGCGVGEKLMFAAIHGGFIVSGFDIIQEYVDLATKYLKDVDAVDRIFKADALEQDYSEWDFIYMYHPIRDREKMKELVKRVTDTCKEGAIMVEVLSGIGRCIDTDGFFNIERQVMRDRSEDPTKFGFCIKHEGKIKRLSYY